MKEVRDFLKVSIKKAIQHPKTTVMGITGVIGGVQMVRLS